MRCWICLRTAARRSRMWVAEIWIEETSPEFGVHQGFTSITKRRQCTLTAAVGCLSRLDDWLMDRNLVAQYEKLIMLFRSESEESFPSSSSSSSFVINDDWPVIAQEWTSVLVRATLKLLVRRYYSMLLSTYSSIGTTTCLGSAMLLIAQVSICTCY